MKKALAYALSLALLLSLTACNKPQTEQPDTSQPEPEATTNQVEPEPEQPAATQLSQSEEQAGVKPFDIENVLQGDRLIEVFQFAYAYGKGLIGSEEEKIQYELEEISYCVNNDFQGKVSLPPDYVEQYIEWRPVEESTDDSAEQATSGGTSNQTSTPTETVQSPSVSDSPAQGTQSQSAETPSEGTPSSGEQQATTSPQSSSSQSTPADYDPNHIETDPNFDLGRSGPKVDPSEYNFGYDGTGWGSAGGFGVGVHIS